MVTFAYKARDSSGKIITGSKKVKDKGALYNELTKNGLFVVEIKKESEKSSFFSLQVRGDPKKKKVKPQHVIVFTRQLHSMLRAGLPLLNGIKVMVEQIGHTGFEAVLSEIADDVKGGATFSEALRKHPKVFDQLYVSMVEAGEEGGVLDEILQRLTLIMEKEEDTKSKIKSAMTYPIIIVVIAVGTVGFLTTFVFPQFIKIFVESEVPLPLPTEIMFTFSNFVRGNWYFLIMAFVISIFAFKKYRGTTQGRYITDAMILKIPMVGELIQKVVLGRFARTLATLYASGVPILTALDIVKKSITNAVILRWMDKVKAGVQSGKSLAKPMHEVGHFPPMMVQMVATGEETGAVSEMLSEIANSYEVEVDYTVKNVTDAIEPLLIVFMGVVVGFTALSLFLPMMDMMKMVK